MIDAPSSESMIGYTLLVLPLFLSFAGWYLIKLIRFLATRPKHFVGIKPRFGWQGQFYTSKHLFIKSWAQQLIDPLIGLPQVFERLGPEKIISHQLAHLRPKIDAIIDDIMLKNNAVIWENLPILVKNRFYARTHKLLPRIVDDIIEELGDNLRSITSYQQLLKYAEKQRPGTLKELYDILSKRSYRAMGWFSAGIGLFASILQCVIAYRVSADTYVFWAVSGAGIGFVLFWLSQQWIVYPASPIPFKRWQLRSPCARLRQHQDTELAEFLSTHILSIRNITGSLLHAGRTHHAHIIIKRRVSVLVESMNVRTFAQLTMGPIGYMELKKTLSDKLTNAIVEPLDDELFNRERSKVVNDELLSQLHKQPDALLHHHIEHILSPLSIIGGVGGFWIGAIAGSLQWLFLFWF